ncbi:hypothetical protein KKH18_13415 [bacterium]|nr:hypothetical protein [bacterium]
MNILFSKHAAYLCFALAVLILFGCALPKLPNEVSWDTEFSVPISQKTYSLSELADGETLPDGETSGIIMSAGDSALFFSHIQAIDPVYPAKEIEMDPIEYDLETTLEGLRVTADIQQSKTIPLAQLNPNLANRHGTVVDVPAFDFQLTVDFPAEADFELACATAGMAEVLVANELGFEFENVQIEWLTHRNNTLDLYSQSLDANSEIESSTNLADRCLSAEMYLAISGSVTGGETLLIDSTAGIEVEITVDTLLVYDYEGPIERQSTRSDSTWALEQRHVIHVGVIDEGVLVLNATNQMSIADSVRITIPDVLTPDGEPIVVEYYLEPSESITQDFELTDHTVLLENTIPQPIHASLEAIIPAEESSRTFSGSNQHVTTNFRTEHVKFKYFNGVLHEQETAIDPDSAEVEDYDDDWESIHPTELDLYLNLEGDVPADGVIDFTLTSTLNGAPLGSVNRGSTVSFNGDTTILYTGLSGLIPQLPQLISYTGTVTLDGAVSVYNTNSVRGTIELKAPLKFTVEPSTIHGDIEEVDFDAIENIQELRLDVKVWNALPVSGWLTLIAARDSMNLIEDSGLPVDTLFSAELPQAVIQQERVTAPGYDELTILLPDVMYDMLENPPFYVRSDIQLNGSGADTLAAYGSDYVTYSSTAHVTYRVESGGNN